MKGVDDWLSKMWLYIMQILFWEKNTLQYFTRNISMLNRPSI